MNHLDKWNDHVKELQRGWIGKSNGANIFFKLRVYKGNEVAAEVPIKIYTTRPETIFGVSFLAMAHDSPNIKELFEANKENWID